MKLATADENRETYTHLHDDIIHKRYHSPYALRRYAHRRQWQIILDLIPERATVLDAGCGDGVLSVLLAKKGCIVTGVDISEPNIKAAKEHASEEGMSDNTHFLLGDIENIPVNDKSHQYVVCSHVLEHVPNFEKGVSELARIAQEKVIIAIPTCCNPCAMTLLGGDSYWVFSRHSLYALPLGFWKVCIAFLFGKEGVQEGYGGHGELVHISRFPWRGKQSIEKGGLQVDRYCASRMLLFPYVSFLLPLTRLLDCASWVRILRNFGHGTTYVCLPHASS